MTDGLNINRTMDQAELAQRMLPNGDDMGPEVAPSYALPVNVFDDWRGAEGLAFVPSDRQRIVLQAVERALSEGLFYSTEIRARCAELLQPSEADKARGAKRIEGGDFGMDVYYARGSLEAKKRHQQQAETLRALRPNVGDFYGVLVFNDYKVSRACKVEEVSDEGEIVLSLCRGSRPGWRVTVSAVQIAYAMDRANEKGARRGGWKDWIAAHPVPEVAPVAEVAPVLDQVQPVPDVAPVLDQVQPVPEVAPELDQVQPVPEVAPTLAQVQPVPEVAPTLDQAQPLRNPLQSTPQFRPHLSHWRNTQHAKRRPAAGHSGPIRQPLQGHARHIGAGLGRPWAGLQKASTGPGKHVLGYGSRPAAGPGNRPGNGPDSARHRRPAGAAPPPRAAGARLVQGTAAPGPGAPGRPAAYSRGPGWRAQAPPPGCRGQCGWCTRTHPPGCRGQCGCSTAWAAVAGKPPTVLHSSSSVSLLALPVSLPGRRVPPHPHHQEIDP